LIEWTPQYFAVQPVLNAQIDADPVRTWDDVRQTLHAQYDLRVPACGCSEHRT